MMKKIMMMLALTVMVVGCAKKRKYESVFVEAPELQIVKTELVDLCGDETDPCLYVPTVGNSPYNVAESRPYSLGVEKVVKLEVREKEVSLLEIEKDERFRNNVNNKSPVLSIPVEHIDYKCVEDEYGDCTNKEEEEDRKTWDQKKFVKLDLDEMKIEETNTLPLDFANLFASGCFAEKKQRMIDFSFEKGEIINITMEKTYEAGIQCLSISSIEDLRYRTFTVEYGYSIVKLSKFADKNYKAEKYSRTDESHFGFFKTEVNNINGENLTGVTGTREYFINKWSPNTDEITYELSSAFYEKGHEKVLEATKFAFDSINRSLNKAKAPFRLAMTPAENDRITDARKNYLMMVTDPQASGVIGYGPSVKNPLTGEILSTRTIMYFGTMKKFISSTYDEFVDEHNEKLGTSTPSVVVAATSSSQGGNSAMMMNSPELMDNFVLQSNVNLAQSSFSRALENHNLDLHFMDGIIPDADIFDTLDENVDLVTLQNRASDLQKQVEEMSKQTFFHGDMVNFEAALLEGIGSMFKAGERALYWDEIDQDKRDEIVNELLPFYWVSTLVHEIGHNLGLRHNFMGSVDTANYYSASESRSLGMNRPVEYSSIMDYPYKNLNSLTQMGKYDIAALRYAYNKEVQLKNGEFVKISDASGIKNLPESGRELKDYEYCSDEHVGSRLLCNRFDEGSNYEELLNYYKESYTKNYKKVNFRRRRLRFESRNGDFGYLLRLFNSLIRVRNFFEIYDQSRALGRFDNPEELTADLVQIKAASDASFDFFMSILETPSYHCAVYNKEDGSFLTAIPFTEYAKLAGFDRQYGITFDLKDGCSFFNGPGSPYIVGDFGKYFNNAIDISVDREQTDNDDASSIDVRGNWIDKMVASMFLTLRFDSPSAIGFSTSGNYLDVPEYRDRFMNFVNSLMTNLQMTEVDIEMNGQTIKQNVTLNFNTTHIVNASYNRFVNFFFNIEKGQQSFTQAFMKMIKPNLEHPRFRETLERPELDLVKILKVRRVSPFANLSDFNYDFEVVFNYSNGEPAYKFAGYNNNEMAKKLFLNRIVFTELKDQESSDVSMMFSVLTGRATMDQLSEEAAATLNALITKVIQEESSLAEGEEPSDEQFQAALSQIVDGMIGILTGSLSEEVFLESFMALSY